MPSCLPILPAYLSYPPAYPTRLPKPTRLAAPGSARTAGAAVSAPTARATARRPAAQAGSPEKWLRVSSADLRIGPFSGGDAQRRGPRDPRLYSSRLCLSSASVFLDPGMHAIIHKTCTRIHTEAKRTRTRTHTMHTDVHACVRTCLKRAAAARRERRLVPRAHARRRLVGRSAQP